MKVLKALKPCAMSLAPTTQSPSLNNVAKNLLIQKQMRMFTTTQTVKSEEKKLHQPMTANDMPRPGGIASYMRLPVTNDGG